MILTIKRRLLSNKHIAQKTGLIFALLIMISSSVASPFAYAAFTTSDLQAILEKRARFDPNAGECTNTTPQDPQVITNTSVYVIGDSYARDSKDMLTTKLKLKGYTDITVNGHGGRGINKPANDGEPGALTSIEQDKEVIKKAGTVIVILGTNASDAVSGLGDLNAYDKSIPTFMDKLHSYNDVARVFWVNTNHDSADRLTLIPPTNKAIAKHASTKNYTVVDWFSALESKTKHDYLDAGSGWLHPNKTRGYPLFTDEIIKAVGLPVSTYNTDQTTTPTVAVVDAAATDTAATSVNLKLLTDIKEKDKKNVPIIWNWIRAKGFTEAQTAGMMGNIYQESKFEVDLWDPPAYGLIQWQDGRYESLKKFAANRNLKIDQIDTQMKFMMAELTSPTGRFLKTVYEPLKKAPDIKTATSIWLREYEQPNNLDQEEILRIKWANEVMATMGGTPVVTPPAATSGSNGCAPVTGNSCEGLLLPTIVDPAKLGAAIDAYIANVSKSYNGGTSPFNGLGSKFVEGGIKSGINPLLGVVHAHKESLFALYTVKGWHNYTFATAAAAAAGDTSKLSPSYNAYGRSAGPGQPTVWYNGSKGPREVYQWSSWEDSLTGTNSFFDYYKNKWVDEKKYTTIDQVIKEYAPASDGNDPNGYAAFMHNNISKLISAAGDAISCGTPGAGAGGSGGSKLDGKETVKLQYGYYVKDGGTPKMIYYSQYDDRFNGSEGKTIYPGFDRTDLGPFGQCGCFSTSMAMAINTIGANKNVTPLDIGKEVLKAGVNAGGCGYSGNAAFGEKLGPIFNVKITSITTIDKAKEGLRSGGLVVVSMGPSVFTSGSHYIVLRGLTSDGKFAVANPTNMSQTVSSTYTEGYINSVAHNEDGRMWVISAK